MGEVQGLADRIRHYIATGESPVVTARVLDCPVRAVMEWKEWQRLRIDVEEDILHDSIEDDRVVSI